MRLLVGAVDEGRNQFGRVVHHGSTEGTEFHGGLPVVEQHTTNLPLFSVPSVLPW